MKNERFISLIATILVICIVMNITVFGVDESCERSEISNAYEEWINEDGEYEYPITQYDEEWYEFTDVTDMRAVTQIPEEILAIISTEELIGLILEYPLLCDLNGFISIGEGYEHVKSQFNGIQELLLRDDAYDVLMSAYKNFNIPVENIINYEYILELDESIDILNEICHSNVSRKYIYDDAYVMNSINILEYLILNVIELNNIDSEEFLISYMEKATEKDVSSHYNNVNKYSMLETTLDEEDNVFSEYASTYSTTDGELIVVYTPGGYSASAKYYETLTMCDTARWSTLVATYNATWVSVASTTFNCHTFAWISDLRTDYQHIMLLDVNPFLNDSYYEESTTAQVGDIVYWGPHSAKVTKINQVNPDKIGDGIQPYCISKWADGPIVMHYMKSCPYYNSTHESAVRYYRPAN